MPSWTPFGLGPLRDVRFKVTGLKQRLLDAHGPLRVVIREANRTHWAIPKSDPCPYLSPFPTAAELDPDLLVRDLELEGSLEEYLDLAFPRPIPPRLYRPRPIGIELPKPGRVGFWNGRGGHPWDRYKRGRRTSVTFVNDLQGSSPGDR